MKKRCKNIQSLLPDFVRGNLSSEQVAAVNHHLETCPHCRLDVTDMEGFREAFLVHPEQHVFAHPTPEDMVLYAEEPLNLGADRRQAIKLHLESCLVCQSELKRLSAVDRALVGDRFRLKNTFQNQWLRAVIWAVPVALFLVLVPRFLPTSEPVPQPDRLRSQDLVKVTLLWPTENAQIGTGELTFRWETVSEALYYEWYLYSLDGVQLGKQRLDSTRFTLPDSMALREGQKYVWGVDAVLGPNHTIPSDLWIFKIRLPKPTD